MLEALSRHLRTGTSWKLIYADDLVIIAESEDKLRRKMIRWKSEMEKNGLRVNTGKTKVMISDPNHDSPKPKTPCGVCRKGVGSNRILCRRFSHWIHNDDIVGSLRQNLEFLCRRCRGIARPIEERPQTKWLLSHADKFDMVDEICYLGDVIGAGGGCGSRITA